MEKIKEQIGLIAESIETGIDLILITMARGDYEGTQRVLRHIRQTTSELKQIALCLDASEEDNYTAEEEASHKSPKN
ncbi:MAG: hypothetical protein HUJ96_06075 [Marinilabiliaceae bacterium]|nr:hypothetical protein [Marinilabiliaceae bacterium]